MAEYLRVINKLDNVNNVDWSTWDKEERRTLLRLYHIITKKEARINDLVYRHHGCDSWEDIFRDYDEQLLHDKAQGVEVALERFDEFYASPSHQ
jgi:hypothetical protein